MTKTFVTLTLVAAIGIGCATVSPPALTAEDPASPDAPVADQAPERPALLAGSEPLAQWLATNRVDASQSEHEHDHGQRGKTPAAKPQPKEHQHQQP